MGKTIMDSETHSSIVSNAFGSRASEYVTSKVHAVGPDLEVLEGLLSGYPEAKILDIGCGGGHVSYLAARHVQSVTAYDLSPGMLEAVRSTALKRGLNTIETVLGRAELLPFENGSFDIVASRYSAHHWQDMARALREAHRVLAPGGLAVFMDVVAPGVPLLDTYLQTIELLRDTSHVRDYTQGEWLSFIEEAGFRLSATHAFRLRPEFSDWTDRMATPLHFSRAIRELYNIAPNDVRTAFCIEDNGSFTVDTVAIIAVRL